MDFRREQGRRADQQAVRRTMGTSSGPINQPIAVLGGRRRADLAGVRQRGQQVGGDFEDGGQRAYGRIGEVPLQVSRAAAQEQQRYAMLTLSWYNPIASAWVCIDATREATGGHQAVAEAEVHQSSPRSAGDKLAPVCGLPEQSS